MDEISVKTENAITAKKLDKLDVLNSVGATREKAWKVVAEALEATRMTVDKFGDEHIEIDHTIRLKASELIAKAHQDFANTDEVKIPHTNIILIRSSTSKDVIDA